MIAVQRWLRRDSAARRALIMQVHDELVFEVRSDARRRGDAPRVRELMAARRALRVPLLVDVGIGAQLGRSALTTARW